jgi:hypothetical protein
MALKLLDGTIAAIDIKALMTAGSTTPTLSIRCMASALAFTFRRPFSQKTTFCNTGWTKPTGGPRTMFAVVSGFMSTGAAFSDPLILFALDASSSFVFTADTGSTITGQWMESEDANSLTAFANSGRSMSFESDDAISTTWVVA